MGNQAMLGGATQQLFGFGGVFDSSLQRSYHFGLEGPTAFIRQAPQDLAQLGGNFHRDLHKGCPFR